MPVLLFAMDIFGRNDNERNNDDLIKYKQRLRRKYSVGLPLMEETLWQSGKTVPFGRCFRNRDQQSRNVFT